MSRYDEPIMTLRLQLRHLPCPSCRKSELMPMLQCDYYPDGCLWVVRCRSCLTPYHLAGQRLSSDSVVDEGTKGGRGSDDQGNES